MPSNFSRGKNELSDHRIRDMLDEYLVIYKKTSSIELNNIDYRVLSNNIRAINAENELIQRILILENNNTTNISNVQKILNWIYNLTGLNL